MRGWLLVLAACGAEVTGRPLDTDAASAPPACEPVTLVSQGPASNATAVPWSPTIVAEVAGGDPATWVSGLSASLAREDGTPVAATVAGQELGFTILPRSALLPDTTYQVRWFDGCAPQSWRFTTAGVSAPEQLSDLIGTTWLVDYRGAGVQSSFNNQPFVEEFLLEAGPRAAWTVLDATTDQLLIGRQYVSAWVEPPEADTCQLGPEPAVWFDVEDGVMTGQWADGTYLVNAVRDLRLGILQRSVRALFLEQGQQLVVQSERATLDMGALKEGCQLFASFGFACEPCPAGTPGDCFAMVLTDVPTSDATGLTLQPVDQVDPSSECVPVPFF